MLSCKRNKFSLPKTITFLNCAYMAPQLKSVEKAGIRAIRQKRNPADISPRDFFSTAELVKAEFAKLVNVANPNGISIIPSVSYGLASVARNVSIHAGDTIIITENQFPSNYYCWQALCQRSGGELKTIGPGPGLEGRGKRWNERILEAIDTRTKVVALAHVHWTDGTKFDLAAIRQRTREVGALLIIDGTQSVGALPFDVNVIQPDALICAAYKWLLGPYSLGVAYYGEYFDNGAPIEDSWMNRVESENFSSLVQYKDQYQEGALRYDMGEKSNFVSLPMLLASLKQINRWHVEDIQQYCHTITKNAIEKLKAHGFWIEDEEFRGSHLIGIRLNDRADAERVKDKLLKNKVYVSHRGDAIRVAPHVYNDERDLERVAKVLISCLS